MREVGVRGYGVDFNAALLELFVVFGEVFKFGRADEGEISRIEEHDGPLAAEIGFGNIDEVAILESGGLERENFGAKNGHRSIPYKNKISNWCDLRLSATHRVRKIYQKHPIKRDRQKRKRQLGCENSFLLLSEIF